MTNLYNEKEFTYMTTRGNLYNFYCYTQSTPSEFRHLVFDYPLPVAKRKGFVYCKDYITKRCYINRTWEAFQYASVLEEAINKVAFIPEDKDELEDKMNNK